jgi:hypothetical protein
MKHLKYFEESEMRDELIYRHLWPYDDCRECLYWEIDTKYPDIAMRKIGVPDSELQFLKKDKDRNDARYHLYIFRTTERDGSYDWTYAGMGFKNPDWRKPPKFMGKIEVEKWEVEADKYNL